MKTLKKTLIILGFLTVIQACSTELENAKTETAKIEGNCEKCKKIIQDAAFKKGIAEADWNPDTKMAVFTFDSKQETLDAILKRVADAGFDNEKHLASEKAYASLPGCCKYDRLKKEILTTENLPPETSVRDTLKTKPTEKPAKPTEKPVKEVNQLKPVFEAYFALKNALVKSESKTASAKALQLKKVVDKTDMEKLNSEQHEVWMKVFSTIGKTAADISRSSDIEAQRKDFAKLSENMIQLANVAELETTVYQQHCPMFNDGKGADWLSTSNTIKNPYYGPEMLTCGKTVKTIK